MTTYLTETCRAPKGKFRVIGIDTFDGNGWTNGDYDLRKAIIVANNNVEPGNTDYHVHDDEGQLIWDAESQADKDTRAVRRILSSFKLEELLEQKDIEAIIRGFTRAKKAREVKQQRRLEIQRAIKKGHFARAQTTSRK